MNLLISLIVPVYNECRAVGPFLDRLDTLIQQRRDQAREDCGDWRTWSLSAHLAAEGGG